MLRFDVHMLFDNTSTRIIGIHDTQTGTHTSALDLIQDYGIPAIVIMRTCYHIVIMQRSRCTCRCGSHIAIAECRQSGIGARGRPRPRRTCRSHGRRHTGAELATLWAWLWVPGWAILLARRCPRHRSCIPPRLCDTFHTIRRYSLLSWNPWLRRGSLHCKYTSSRPPPHSGPRTGGGGRGRSRRARAWCMTLTQAPRSSSCT